MKAIEKSNYEIINQRKEKTTDNNFRILIEISVELKDEKDYFN